MDMVPPRPQPFGMVDSSAAGRPGFYEFFAGGGMARAGLGARWQCLFANDIDPAKGEAYRDNWGGRELRVGDIADVPIGDLPGVADLMWGSFPCQDLSLAGAGAGLGGVRSGTFHAFWDVARGLAAATRAPRIVTVENVCGTLTSRGGCDFEVICRAFAEAGYRWGALIINADRFLPQSRPRLFVIGVHRDVAVAPGLTSVVPLEPFHSAGLVRALGRLPGSLADTMVWWSLSPPDTGPVPLASLVDDGETGQRWHSQAQTTRLLALMSAVNLAKVAAAQAGGGGASGRRAVGALFRRTRRDPGGGRVQRAEVRFDMAGCLRTPGGGSSRQALLVIDEGRVRSRLMSPRETARLMGLPEDYRLPTRDSAAFHLTGDGVAVPVVRYLADRLFEPLLELGEAKVLAA